MDAELTQREIELQEEVNKGMDVIERFVNNMTNDRPETGEVVAKYFIRMHRTLQESLVRLIYNTIQSINKFHEEHPNYYDARNEYAIKWIQEVAKNKTYFPYI